MHVRVHGAQLPQLPQLQRGVGHDRSSVADPGQPETDRPLSWQFLRRLLLPVRPHAPAQGPQGSQRDQE